MLNRKKKKRTKSCIRQKKKINHLHRNLSIRNTATDTLQIILNSPRNFHKKRKKDIDKYIKTTCAPNKERKT